MDDKTANKGSANYTKYARDFDQKYPNWYNGKKNGYAWCDMFVDWCFLTAFGYEKALCLLCQPEKSDVIDCRVRILTFADEIRRGVRHSKETFDQVLSDIDTYERYCTEHPDFMNNKTVAAKAKILDVYSECMDNNDFL